MGGNGTSEEHVIEITAYCYSTGALFHDEDEEEIMTF
jgi:hypothetical protein